MDAGASWLETPRLLREDALPASCDEIGPVGIRGPSCGEWITNRERSR